MIVDDTVDGHDLEITVQEAEEPEIEFGNVIKSVNVVNKSDGVNRMKPRLSVIHIVEQALGYASQSMIVCTFYTRMKI